MHVTRKHRKSVDASPADLRSNSLQAAMEAAGTTFDAKLEAASYLSEITNGVAALPL